MPPGRWVQAPDPRIRIYAKVLTTDQRAQAMPAVLARHDHQRHRGVILERTSTQQSVALRAQPEGGSYPHATQIRRHEAGTSQPANDVLRSLALALNVSADSLLFDNDERGPKNATLRLKLEAVDQFTPEEQEHVAAFIERALLRHHARQAFSGQAI